MQDCLETLIKQNQDGDPEILWALTSVFANQFSEDGKHPKQVVNAKQHVVEIVEKSGNLKLFETFKQRLDYFIRTNITPRHWSKLTSKYWQLQHLALPEEDLQSGQDVYAESPQKMYKLEGEAVTIQEIKDQLSASFEDYKETIQKLKDENQSFYESALTDSALKLHISQTPQSLGLLSIKDYLMSEGKWSNADLLRKLGHRFMDLGDVKNGLECLELAYSNTMDWSRWKRNQHDFKVISEYDTQRAIKLLVSESYRFLTEYSGYEVPASVASAYDVLGDIQNLKRVYQDYLQHCQELFEQLPKRKAYKWLKDYPPEADDFDQLVVQFLVDELDTIEIDLGNRLIDAYRELCLARPEITLPIFVERLLNADELPKNRLLTILYMVASDSPHLFIPYAEKISDLLNSKNNCRS